MNSLIEKVNAAMTAIENKPEQDSADYAAFSALSETLQYLQKERFISVDERLPVIKGDCDYECLRLIVAVRNTYGDTRVCPAKWERTLVRGKRVERWTDWTGRLMENTWQTVTHWKEFPECPITNEEQDKKEE